MIYNIENQLCESIDHHVIYKYLMDSGYTDDVLSTLFNEQVLESIDKCDFNSVLRVISKTHKIPIFDILVYIEKKYVDGKKVWDVILDDRNKVSIQKETKKSYNIKIEECSMSDLF